MATLRILQASRGQGRAPQMDARLLAVAAQIATPLSLSAVCVIGSYWVYRKVLQQKLLTKLGPQHGFRILDRIVTFVFVVALVGLFLGALCFIFPSFSAGKATGAVRA